MLLRVSSPSLPCVFLSVTNGLRAPTQPSVSNGALVFRYSYQISDGATYIVSGNLTVSTSSQFATNIDPLGNPYQIVTNVTGTRTYTHIPTGSQITSTVTGLSKAAQPLADQVDPATPQRPLTSTTSPKQLPALITLIAVSLPLC